MGGRALDVHGIAVGVRGISHPAHRLVVLGATESGREGKRNARQRTRLVEHTQESCVHVVIPAPAPAFAGEFLRLEKTKSGHEKTLLIFAQERNMRFWARQTDKGLVEDW